MALGGKRPGAGRKKAQHTIETEKARQLLIEMVTAEWTPLIRAQLDLAQGVKVTDDDGETVYSEAPDRGAIEYLINQVIGKPKETHELGGAGGKPIPVQLIDFSTYKPNVITE